MKLGIVHIGGTWNGVFNGLSCLLDRLRWRNRVGLLAEYLGHESIGEARDAALIESGGGLFCCELWRNSVLD